MANLYLGQRFVTFKDFEDALQAYEKENHIVFTTTTSCSIANENKKLIGRGVSQLYKPELEHKYLLLRCKFGGPVRIGKGDGTRQFQS